MDRPAQIYCRRRVFSFIETGKYLSKAFTNEEEHHREEISEKTRSRPNGLKIIEEKSYSNYLFVYSRSLCQSAICRRGELQTSFQWFNAEPVLRGPPSSSLPITSFLVTRSQSSSISSRETPSRVWPVPSVVGMSNAKLSLKTGLKVRFLTWVFFLAIRCPCEQRIKTSLIQQ